jgi:hypothetical protein
MRLTPLRPSPSMAVAIVALVVSASGVTWAATSLPNNSVDSDTIVDNSVRSRDIRTDQVKQSDINRNAVAGEEVVDNTLTGDDIFEQSLGTVPFAQRSGEASTAQRAVDADFATHAADAQRLGGRPPGAFVTSDEVVPFKVRLSFGQKVEFISNGPIGLEADCRENISGDQDELRLLGVTSQDGAFMQGDTPHSGPGANSDTLDTDTPEDNRTMGGIVSLGPNPNATAVDDDIDTGFVAGPNGEYIGIDETTMYALRLGGGDCLLVGLAVVR